ncbi:hypothetical protein HPP92_026562 [Vanilla planifolia]|uniref:Uncharacterized protein n=1 Tax=Vanilla planifolia TaxID=51239 RepID=A0A835PFU4_VANPL|nr:hypothetical protein HPP92_026562 [Vanilla planifolia]
MEKKQGFFAVLKEGMVRGTTAKPPFQNSPSLQSRGPADPALLGSHLRHSWRGWTRTLQSDAEATIRRRVGANGFGGQFSRAHSVRPALVSAALTFAYSSASWEPHAPTHESSSAQYILQQYIAGLGGSKLQSFLHNASTLWEDKKMTASEFETATMVARNRSSEVEKGWFCPVAEDPGYVDASTRMTQDVITVKDVYGIQMWFMYLDFLKLGNVFGTSRAIFDILVVGGWMVWLLLTNLMESKGLDPLTTATVFANARFIGEKKVKNEDCFVLKLSAEPIR